MMTQVYNEVLAKLNTKTGIKIRYINWDIGQMTEYFQNPSITFPAVLISFTNINPQTLGDNLQLHTVRMQLKIVNKTFSQTSNLTPELIRSKGLEIWTLEKEIFKLLQGKDGDSYGTMNRINIQQEQRLDGLLAINSTYEFTAEDNSAVGATTKKTIQLELEPELEAEPITVQFADYINLNSDTYVLNLCDNGGLYAYSCREFYFNGQSITIEASNEWTYPNLSTIPVQEEPYVTIPDHSIDDGTQYLTYDDNFLMFLYGSKLSNYLSFDKSPFCERVSDGPDDGFPTWITASAKSPISTDFVYGEGFQIRWKKGDTFLFKVEFFYKANDSAAWVLGHTVVYTNENYVIDGAIVPIKIAEYEF